MLHRVEKKKTKMKWMKRLIALFVVLIPLSLVGVGFAAFKIESTSQKSNISVNAANVSTYDVPSISITAEIASDPIYFDAEVGDESGSVTRSADYSSSTSTEIVPNLDIQVTGYITNHAGEWESIKTSLTVSGSNSSGTSYQSIYEDLINDGYIVHPTFDALPNDGTYGTNNSKWTMSAFTDNRWTFEVNSSFGYGEIFGNMNPSAFFDSETFNGAKKGSEYTKAEIRKMLSRLQELDGAQYVVTMRVLTESNGSKLTLQAGATGAKGTFVTTNSSSDIVYSNLLSGDRITFPEVYRSNYSTDYYYCSSSSLHSTDSAYRFEVGRSYDFGVLLSTHGKSQGTDLVFLPHYTSTVATLTVGCGTSSTDYLTVNYVVAWYSSNSGTTTSTKTVTSNSSWTQTLNIGDVVSFSMSGSSCIKTYSVSGFKGVEDGTVYKKSAYFTVATNSPKIIITPFGSIAIPITWNNQTLSSNQTDPSLMTDPAALSVTNSIIATSTFTYGNNLSLPESSSFAISNAHGVVSYSVISSTSGETVSPDSSGNYTVSDDIEVIATVAPAISISWSIKTGSTSSSMLGTDGPELYISYKKWRNDSEEDGDREAGNGSVSQDLSSSSSGSSSGTLVVSTKDSVYIKAVGGEYSGASVSVKYTNGSSIYSGSGSGKTYETTTTYSNDVTVAVTGAYGSCLLPDVLILMADGSYEKVKDIVAGDYVMALDHETGNIVPSMVLFNDSEPNALTDVLYLDFSGKKVGVIAEHGFFDVTLNKYVYLTTDNCTDYIGHEFAYLDDSGNIENRVLSSVHVKEEYTECYSPVTYSTLNYFTEGMLSMPGGISGLFNYFEYDRDNLAYDAERKAVDIDTYGLFTYEDFADTGLSEEAFYAYNGQYLKVSIGKGLLTWDDIEYLISRYGSYF